MRSNDKKKILKSIIKFFDLSVGRDRVESSGDAQFILRLIQLVKKAETPKVTRKVKRCVTNFLQLLSTEGSARKLSWLSAWRKVVPKRDLNVGVINEIARFIDNNYDLTLEDVQNLKVIQIYQNIKPYISLSGNVIGVMSAKNFESMLLKKTEQDELKRSQYKLAVELNALERSSIAGSGESTAKKIVEFISNWYVHYSASESNLLTQQADLEHFADVIFDSLFAPRISGLIHDIREHSEKRCIRPDKAWYLSYFTPLKKQVALDEQALTVLNKELHNVTKVSCSKSGQEAVNSMLGNRPSIHFDVNVLPDASPHEGRLEDSKSLCLTVEYSSGGVTYLNHFINQYFNFIRSTDVQTIGSKNKFTSSQLGDVLFQTGLKKLPTFLIDKIVLPTIQNIISSDSAQFGSMSEDSMQRNSREFFQNHILSTCYIKHAAQMITGVNKAREDLLKNYFKSFYKEALQAIDTLSTQAQLQSTDILIDSHHIVTASHDVVLSFDIKKMTLRSLLCAHEERLLSEGYGRLTDDVQFDQFIKNNRVFVKGQGVVTTDVPLNAKASINVGRLHFEYIPHFESIVEQIKHFFRWSVAKGSVVIQTPFKGQESSRVTKGRSLQESDSHDVLIKFYSGEGEHILRKVRALLGSLIQSSVDEHTVSLAKTPGEQSPDSVTSPLVSDENRVIDLSNLDSEDVVTDLTGDSGTSGSNSTVSRVSTIVLKSPYALLESSIRLAFPIYMSAESENIILNTEHFAKTQQSLQTAFGNDGASSTKGYHYGYIIPRTKKINRMVHLDDLSVDSADVAYELLSLNEQSVISAKNSMLLLDYTNFCSAKSGLIDWLNKLPTQPLSEPAIDERSKAFNSTVNASCQTFLTIQQQIRTICKGLNGTFKSSYRFSGQETVVKPSYEYFDRQWFMDLVSELGGSIYNLFYMERLFVDAGKKANGENVFIDPFDYRIHAQRHFLHDPLSFVSSRHYENMIQGSLSKGRYDSSNLATLINTNVAKQCNANMVYVEGEIYPLIKATREILKGEQIFLDYGSGWEERLEYLKGERKKHNFNNSIVSQRLAGENSPKSSRFYFDECDECKKRLYIEELDTMPIDVEAPDVGLRPVKRQRVVPTIFSPGDNIAQTDLLGAKRSSEKIYQQNALSDLNSRNATWYHDNIKLNYSKQDGFYLTVKKNIPRNTFLAYYKGKVVHKDHFNTCCKFLTDIGLFNDLEAIMEREKSGAAPSLIMRSSFFKYFSARDYHAEGNRNHSNKTSSGLSL